MIGRAPCTCGAQGDKCAPVAPRFHKPGCPQAAHLGYVESEFGSTWFKAVCSCGLDLEPTTSEEKATAQLKAHYDETRATTADVALEEGTRILRVDLPADQPLPTLTQKSLVDHVKRLWKMATAQSKDVDLVGLIVTGGAFNFKAMEGINPRMFTSRVGSGPATAAACGSMLDDIRAQGDNVHLAVAVSAIRRYIAEEALLARQRRAGGKS